VQQPHPRVAASRFEPKPRLRARAPRKALSARELVSASGVMNGCV
jgi:hypothetical protein